MHIIASFMTSVCTYIEIYLCLKLVQLKKPCGNGQDLHFLGLLSTPRVFLLAGLSRVPHRVAVFFLV